MKLHIAESARYTLFIISNIHADAADLKSADPNRSWGFKSPSGHQLLSVIYMRLQTNLPPLLLKPVLL